jgi:DNA-binding NarL/FixJ family response regulator
VIDDHRVFADTFAFVLDAQPDLRCVAVAYTARDGLLEADARHIDVAIVDLRLPDAGGLSVVEQLRVRHPSARLILLTGHADAEVARHARAIGAVPIGVATTHGVGAGIPLAAH